MQVTKDHWKCFIKQTTQIYKDLTPLPTVEGVVEHNIAKLHAIGQPIATIKAVQTGPNAAKASQEDAGGLQPVLYLAHGACVMLISNLWIDVVVNGAVGTITTICYLTGGPPNLLIAIITVHFDSYAGPTLPDGSVPISPIHQAWSSSGTQYSQTQLQSPTTDNGTLIDHIHYNKPSAAECCRVQVIDAYYSDHDIIHCSFQMLP